MPRAALLWSVRRQSCGPRRFPRVSVLATRRPGRNACRPIGCCPKYPSLICHTTIASQWSVVGSALNWQGQPQLQLQFTISSPAIRHLIFVGSLIFSRPLSREISRLSCASKEYQQRFYSVRVIVALTTCFGISQPPGTSMSRGGSEGMPWSGLLSDNCNMTWLLHFG